MPYIKPATTDITRSLVNAVRMFARREGGEDVLWAVYQYLVAVGRSHPVVFPADKTGRAAFLDAAQSGFCQERIKPDTLGLSVPPREYRIDEDRMRLLLFLARREGASEPYLHALLYVLGQLGRSDFGGWYPYPTCPRSYEADYYITEGVKLGFFSRSRAGCVKALSRVEAPAFSVLATAQRGHIRCLAAAAFAASLGWRLWDVFNVLYAEQGIIGKMRSLAAARRLWERLEPLGFRPATPQLPPGLKPWFTIPVDNDYNLWQAELALEMLRNLAPQFRPRYSFGRMTKARGEPLSTRRKLPRPPA